MSRTIRRPHPPLLTPSQYQQWKQRDKERKKAVKEGQTPPPPYVPAAPAVAPEWMAKKARG